MRKYTLLKGYVVPFYTGNGIGFKIFKDKKMKLPCTNRQIPLELPTNFKPGRYSILLKQIKEN